MRVTAKRLREVGRIPRFYGVAWFDVAPREYVCYPWPFNFSIAWLRRIWLRTRFAIPFDPIDHAYGLGLMDGRAEGRKSEMLDILRDYLLGKKE